MSDPPVSAQAFEQRYGQSADPWNFAASPYEVGRYQLTLRALHRQTYPVVYEPGCSIGVLTRALGERARHVIAVDFAQTAVTQARARCADQDNVEIHVADVETFRPRVAPDLIVFSEIGYYFPAPVLTRIASALSAQLQPHGEFVAVHWLGDSADHVLHGNEVHEILHRALNLAPWVSERHDGFRLDSWRGE